MTLPIRLVEKVRTLLARGLSPRAVQRLTAGAAGRTTIAKIAAGNYHPPHPKPADTYENEPAPVVAKCPGCNYLVEMPCKICQARRFRHATHLARINRRRRKRPL
jgi:hypothetical protein